MFKESKERTMEKTFNRHTAKFTTALALALAVTLAPVATFAQTRITAPSNRYSVSQDVQAGRQASQQVEQQLPMVRDRYVEDYISRLGERLVDAIPSEFQHREFRYQFRVIDARDINAFALPGGYLYFNRGMIEAARTEGQIAGVMAHEISHVALRHGTAQASRAGSVQAQAPAIIGGILGAILGGPIGGIAQTAGQIGSGAIITRYSREFETQADILGAQIMARAGYDPRDLAEMFQIIERQSGGGGGQIPFLSSHPSPANRYARINQEAALLRVSPDRDGGDSRGFYDAQARLRQMPRARTMEEIARSGQRYPSGGGGGTNRGGYGNRGGGGRVEYPSARYRTVQGGNLYRVQIPDNWREFGGDQNSMTYAPEGAYNEAQGRGDFTHAVIIGVTNSQSNDLYEASSSYVNALLQNNPNYRAQSRDFQRGSIGRRQALAMTLYGPSSVTGRTEIVTVYTTQLRDGSLFYLMTVAPQDESRNYANVFQNILRTLEING
jgi:beta-barrel assembly-enhancing protease